MILPHLGAYQGLAWFGTLESVSPRVTVLLEKKQQKHQRIQFNLKLEILLWSNKETL